MSRIDEIIESARAPAIRIEGRTHGAMRPAGYTFLTDPELPSTVENDTLMCIHCQYHWQVIPGSGIERGWCRSCNGPTCGKKKCYLCRHFEKKLEEIEAHGRVERNLLILKSS